MSITYILPYNGYTPCVLVEGDRVPVSQIDIHEAETDAYGNYVVTFEYDNQKCMSCVFLS